MEHTGEKKEQAQAVSPIGQVADEALTDQVSDQLAPSLDSSAEGQELSEPMQEVVLEEEGQERAELSLGPVQSAQ